MPRRARVMGATCGGWQQLPDDLPPSGLARHLWPSRGVRFAHNVAIGRVSIARVMTGDNLAHSDVTRRDIVVQGGSKRGALDARVRSDAR